MSLILDALKRSESEQRGALSVSVVEETPVGLRHRRGRVVGFAVGLSILVLLCLGLWMFGQDITTSGGGASATGKGGGATMQQAQEATQQAKDQVILSQELSQGERVPASKSGSIGLQPAPGRSMPEAEESRAVSSRTADELVALNQAMWDDAELTDRGAADQKVESAIARGAGEEADSDSVSPTDSPIPTAEPVVGEPALDLQEVMQRLALEAGETTLVPHPVPLLETLTQQQKDRVPTIIYSAHEYRSDGSSFVELNGSLLRPGQSGDAIRVVEILADSVILSAAGTEFRLKALNSWINL